MSPRLSAVSPRLGARPGPVAGRRAARSGVRLAGATLIAGLLVGPAAHAKKARDEGPREEMALLGPAFLAQSMPYSGKLAEALAQRDHATAAPLLLNFDHRALRGQQVRSHAFVTAWTLIRAGRVDEAVRFADEVEAAEGVPADYRLLVLAELRLADGRPNDAVLLLNGLSGDTQAAIRGKVLRAKAQMKMGSTKEAAATWRELADRPDPADGNDVALLNLAMRSGMGSPEAYALLRRLWSAYPRSKEGREADKLLSAHYPNKSATDLELALRAEQIMNSGDFTGAIALLQPMMGRLSGASEAACIAWYTVGRSQFKKNNVSMAAQILVPAGQRCASIDKDRGAKSLYLAGMSYERKKSWPEAGQAFGLIPALYAGHYMADDGYARGGIAWQLAGEPKRAIDMWERQVKEYPEGDLTAEAYWRLAWNAYLAEDSRAAIGWADALVENVDPVGDPVHYYAGRYWQGRWRLYPSYAAPTRLTADRGEKERGIDLLAELCAEDPTQFYSLLASGRLTELAPDRLAAIERPPAVGAPNNWTVRASFIDHPAVAAGVQLMRLGLVSDALVELETQRSSSLLPSEFSMINEIRGMKDPVVAHDLLHKYLLERPASDLGPDRDRILRQAYPNTWWPEVQAATASHHDRMDPRVFHALVREESSFNPNAVSWAGARGLSQLMPATAKHIAGKVGVSLANNGILDPVKNLTIGGYYLNYLHGYFDGNPYLAVPAYNAGEGNVGSWAKTWGSRPTDEFVEAIPIRETRHYVKRVLGTYQLYRVVWGEGDIYPDLSATNHVAWRR